MMTFTARVLGLIALVGCLSAANPEETSESDFIAVISTTDVGFPGTDNGMALGEIPELGLFSAENEDPGNVTTMSSAASYAIAFPDNHKNYTDEVFPGSIELPPLLNHYRDQYETFNKMKQEYNQKPITFEEGMGKNRHETKGLWYYLDDSDHDQNTPEPFPYAYDTEKQPTYWPLHYNEAIDHYGQQQGQPYVIRLEEHDIKKEEPESSNGWKKALKFFTALVPLGILLASLTPNLIVINSTADQRPIGQRSLKDQNVLGDDLEWLSQKLEAKGGDWKCDARRICELSRARNESSSTYVQRRFWSLANKTSDDVADMLGLKELFQAIRTSNCESLKCRENQS